MVRDLVFFLGVFFGKQRVRKNKKKTKGQKGRGIANAAKKGKK